jgi:hypothetical protein
MRVLFEWYVVCGLEGWHGRRFPRSRSRHLTVLKGPNPSLLCLTICSWAWRATAQSRCAASNCQPVKPDGSPAYWKMLVKLWRTGNSNDRCFCYLYQVPKLVSQQLLQRYIHVGPQHDGWKEMPSSDRKILNNNTNLQTTR